ncbi:hypothetical protein HDV06_002696 [Boothiomyces sp. JEL0866]|nr:hypothetical protein HDV06_002696 [Boothiomyces sp. JEL0866]
MTDIQPVEPSQPIDIPTAKVTVPSLISTDSDEDTNSPSVSVQEELSASPSKKVHFIMEPTIHLYELPEPKPSKLEKFTHKMYLLFSKPKSI